MNKTICIISAFYNEEANLSNHIKNLEKVRLKLKDQKFKVNFVLVNDGSTDDSLKILKKLSKNKKYIKILNLTKNYGQQVAIYVALKENNADYYGAIDSDGQQDPILFLKMARELKKKNVEIIQMKKKYGFHENFIKSFFSKIFYIFFTYLTNIDLKPGSSDFYLITKKIRNEIIKSEISKYFLRGFIHWTGLPKIYIEYKPSKRKKGNSKYSMNKQLDFGLTAIYLYGTNLFIKIFILCFVLIILSFGFIVYSIYEHYVHNVQVPGWASIIILVTFFGALNIFFISLITFFSIKFGNFLSMKQNYFIK